ncbi:TMV resistance protein N-like [Senna tora]|uniref:TMV resistance protein N-like n=1 Tax=Senna tora TaxID=362788 RepID=A0A835CJY0_9FABA|nr:TMV resistance protein N-like [Senna tora]
MPFLLRSFSRGLYAKSSEKLEAIPSKSENSGTKVEALIASHDPIHIAGSTDFSAELEAGPSASQISCTKAPALIGFHDSVHIAESRNLMNSLIIQVGGVNKVNHILLESILQGWREGEFDDDSLPGDNYPVWLTFKGEASSVYFRVPQVINCNLRGMILCIVYSSTLHTMASVFPDSFLIQNYTKATIDVYKQDVAATDDEQWKSILSNLEPCHEVEVTVAFGLTQMSPSLEYSSSSESDGSICDVFLAYATGCNTISSFQNSLRYIAVDTFIIDDHEWTVDSLFEDIKWSKIVVIIFTEKFVDSPLSLMVFEAIMRCHRNTNKVVFAVFWRETNGNNEVMRVVRFEDEFQRLIARTDDEEQLRWRSAAVGAVVKCSWEVSTSTVG